jgi:hypothetical protein
VYSTALILHTKQHFVRQLWHGHLCCGTSGRSGTVCSHKTAGDGGQLRPAIPRKASQGVAGVVIHSIHRHPAARRHPRESGGPWTKTSAWHPSLQVSPSADEGPSYGRSCLSTTPANVIQRIQSSAMDPCFRRDDDLRRDDGFSRALLLDYPDLDLGMYVGVQSDRHAIDAERLDRLVKLDLTLLHV